MKTNIINKLAAMLTVSGLLSIIAPLTVTAQNLVVSNSAVTASGTHYENRGTTVPLSVSGSLGSFTGDNITITGTTTSGITVGNRGTLNLTDSAITAGGSGISVTDTSVVNLVNTSITSGTVNNSAGIVLNTSSTLTMTGGSITNTATVGNTYGVGADNNNPIWAQFNNVTITTSGTRGMGVVAGFGSYVELNDSTVTVLGLVGGNAAVRARTNATIVANHSTINSINVGASSSGTLILNDSIVNVTGTWAALHTFYDTAMESVLIVTGGTVTTGGDLLLTGGGTATLTDVDTSGAGGITSTVANNINGNVTINGGSGVNGSVTHSGNGTLNVSFNDTSLTGNIVGNGNGTMVFTASNSALTGDLDNQTLSITTLNLNNSTLTGKTLTASAGTLTVNVDNNSTWTMTDNSILTNLALSNSGKVVFQKDAGFKTLTTRNLSGSGIFEMNTDIVSGTADRLIVSGTSAGAHQVRITNHGEQTLGNEPALLLIETADGQATFSGTVSVGMFDYSLYQDQTDWYLSVSGTNLPPNPPPTPAPPTISDGGKIVLIVPPSIGQNWFDHTKTISNHLGDLRDDKAGILEALWVRSYGAQLNIAPNMVGSGVREYQYGVDIGSDHRLNLDKDNTLIVGGFVGYGRIDRTLRNGFGSTADTDNYHAGLYAIWQHECGLWADVIAKGQYADSQFSAWDASQNHMTASYGNWAGGVTLDLGKKFSFKDGWYVEPSASAGYAHFMGNDYATGGNNVFAVSISDADLFQFRVGVAFGRTLKLKNSGVLQPYIKVAGVEQVSAGGKLRASGHEWRPNFDGARAEVGGGIIWQLNADHQLSLDYEASFGDKYDKPWGLTAGYRYQF